MRLVICWGPWGGIDGTLPRSKGVPRYRERFWGIQVWNWTLLAYDEYNLYLFTRTQVAYRSHPFSVP